MSMKNHNKLLSYLEYQERDFRDYVSLFRGKSAPIVDDEQYTSSD
ncbi:MAG: hypothetical protein WBQ25_03665 [Nitrososphaeraceae archaeon]